MSMSVEHIISIGRGLDYANKVDKPEVWSHLAKAQLDGLGIKDSTGQWHHNCNSPMIEYCISRPRIRRTMLKWFGHRIKREQTIQRRNNHCRCVELDRSRGGSPHLLHCHQEQGMLCRHTLRLLRLITIWYCCHGPLIVTWLERFLYAILYLAASSNDVMLDKVQFCIAISKSTRRFWYCNTKKLSLRFKSFLSVACRSLHYWQIDWHGMLHECILCWLFA